MAGREATGGIGALTFRPAVPADGDALWRILEPMIRMGEVFALPRDMRRDAALAYWTGEDHDAQVAESAGRIVGTYYIRPNQLGGGQHVANAGYATATEASGHGVARQMCAHSLDRARLCGFRAMQFNFVVGSNAAAIHLWGDMGFAIVGRLPGAFAHPRLGDVDALVMWRAI